MDDETLLPIGEPVVISEKESPLPPLAPKVTLPGVPSPAQQSWGAVISIVIIVLMVIIGAFYAWGQRISQNQPPAAISQ